MVMARILLPALAAAAAICSGTAMAQSSKEYAMMAKASWAAFECTALASVLQDFEEEKRLFDYGYEQGRRYLAAFREGKVTGSDVVSTVPLPFQLAAPTAEFVLGTVYEKAQQHALSPIEAGKKDRVQMYSTGLAKARFRSANCALIGK
jgi:hypothetical protein